MSFDVLVRSHVDTSGSGGLPIGEHLVPRANLTDYETFFYLGQMTFHLPINQWEGLNQQVNEQVFELYRSDENVWGSLGTVSSVGLSMPGEFGVTGSPITTTGTFGVSWQTQTANKLFSGPASGGAAAPGFRAMAIGDIPDSLITYGKIQNTSNSSKVLGRKSLGGGVIEEIDFNALARTLANEPDTASFRADIGLGSMAIQNKTAVDITGGTITGGTITGAAIGYFLSGNFSLSDDGDNHHLYINWDDFDITDRGLNIHMGGATRDLTFAGNATISGTNLGDQTFIPRRTRLQASTASLTPDANSYDVEILTALAAGLTINAPTGSPTSEQPLTFRIKDNGVARTIAWNAIFRSVGVTLPTTTVVSKVLRVMCIYNITDTKWDVVGVVLEGAKGVSGAGTVDTIPIWTSATELADSQLSFSGSAFYFGGNTLLDVVWGGDAIDLASQVTNRLPFANFTQGLGASVIGVSGTSTANVASIQALNDNSVLRKGSGGAGIDFGAILLTSSNAVTGRLPASNFQQGSARSVFGVTGNAIADYASIQGTTNQVLRVDTAGTGLAFGAINLASSAAVTGDLPLANIAQQVGAGVLGVATGVTADLAMISYHSVGDEVLRVNSAGNAIAFGQVNLASTDAVTGALPGANINYNTTNLKVTSSQLNTIQNITTSSDVQFGNVGIGVASGGNIFYAQGTGTVTSRTRSSNAAGRVLFQVEADVAFFDMRAHGSTYSETLFGNSMTQSSAILGRSGLLTIGTYENYEFVLGTNNTERIRLTGSGLQMADAQNIVVNTSTGTKIGTSTSQKLGFWNKTPIVQPTTGVTGATYGGIGANTMYRETTADGYTFAQVVAALRNTGLLA